MYKLGAARFDELLFASIDECTRSFVNGIWLSQVFDLKGEMAKKMLDDLTKRFQEFGIQFLTCNVTQVHVSQQLTQALTEKAKIRYELQNHIKEFENKKLTLENSENQQLTNLKKKNERELQELKAKIERAKIEKEQAEIKANTELEVAIVGAEQNASVLITKA